MKLQHKIFLILSLVFIVAFGVLEYMHFQSEKLGILKSVRQEARNIRGILMSTRRVYHQQFLESGIPLNEKTLGFLPAHALSRISEDFKNWSDYQLTFNNVSDRPRNPDNLADPLEMEAIEFYRKYPDASERFVPYSSPGGEEFYHFSTPIRVEQYCLKCHGRREDAPPTIRDTYTTAFDYKVGELRGIMSIKLPTDRINALVWKQFRVSALVHFATFSILFIALTALIARYVTTPLARLDKGLKRIGSGEYYHSIEGLSGEMDEIAKTFDNTAKELSEREDELKIKNEHRKALNAILIIAQQNIPLEEQLDSVLQALLSNIWLQVQKKGAIFYVDNESRELVLAVSHGFSDALKTSCSRVPFGKCLCGRAAETGKVVFSSFIDDDHEITYDGIKPHGHYCVPIKTAEEVMGIINLFVNEGHRFDESEEEFLISVANTLASLFERKSAEEQLTRSLDEKKVLLTEIHHRVKNNLQVISGFLQIQSDASLKNPAITTQNALQESQSRIKSMAVIHDLIYRSGHVGSAEINECINAIGIDLIDTYHMTGRVEWALAGDKVLLNIDQAIPCALIINELIMNSLKHAFGDDKTGKIEVSFTEDDSKMIEILVSDDGVGIGDEINWEAPTSIGLDLVKGLTNQIDGSIELDRSSGTRFKIRFERI